MTYRALLLGFTVQEVPITFADRVAGGSKMSRSIVFEAMRRVPLLRLEAARGRCLAQSPETLTCTRPASARFDGCGDLAHSCSRRPRAASCSPSGPASRSGRTRSARRSRARRSSGTGRPRRRCSCRSRTPATSAAGEASIDGARRLRQAAHDRQGPRARARQRRRRRPPGAHRRRIRSASSATASTRRSRSTSTRTSRRWRSTACRPAGARSREISGRVEPGSKLALSYEGAPRRRAIRARARSRSTPICPTAARPCG